MSREDEGLQVPTQIDGHYTNYFKVGHNAFEFLLDFGQLYPESMNAQLHSRIITSPKCAKFLLESLQEAIEKYERSFESIHIGTLLIFMFADVLGNAASLIT